MRNALKYYVDGLFADVNMTPDMLDLRDEILSDMQERFDDCVKRGMHPRKAYCTVIETLGDIDELIKFHEQCPRPIPVIMPAVSGDGFFDEEIPLNRDKAHSSGIIRKAVLSICWLIMGTAYFTGIFEFGYFSLSWGAAFIGLSIAATCEFMGIQLIGYTPPQEKTDRIRNIASGLVLGISGALYLICEPSMPKGFAWIIAWIIALIAGFICVGINFVCKLICFAKKGDKLSLLRLISRTITAALWIGTAALFASQLISMSFNPMMLITFVPAAVLNIIVYTIFRLQIDHSMTKGQVL